MALGDIHDAIRPYAQKNDLRALGEVLATFLIFIPIALALYRYRENALCLTIGSLAGALLLVRIFSLGHEAGHAALFSGRATNRWVGRSLALFALIPYACWHRMHYVHHQQIGKIGHEHEGYLWLMTKHEYRSSSRLQRLCYRTYHHPMVRFVVGPIVQFVLIYRWPGIGRTAADRRSIHVTNVVIAGLFLVIHETTGIAAFVQAFALMYIIAAGLGSWLFFIQHVAESTYWSGVTTWDRKGALLRGSTYYDIPRLLRWCIANACYHPLHHLNAGIPCYRLRECWEAHPLFFADCPRVTLRESMRMFRLALWDEEQKRMTD